MLLKPKINEIKKKRNQLGITKHKLSILSGLGKSSISRIESGDTKLVHSLRAKAIADTLGCHVEDIFNISA